MLRIRLTMEADGDLELNGEFRGELGVCTLESAQVIC
jgi:hypothetical protein